MGAHKKGVAWRKGKLSLIGGGEEYRGIFSSMAREIRYYKFAIFHEEIGLLLTFPFTSLKMETNSQARKAFSKQLLSFSERNKESSMV